MKRGRRCRPSWRRETRKPRTRKLESAVACLGIQLSWHSVRHNASSPLLSLPVEVRQRIWHYALGDRLIHIKFATTHRWEGNDSEHRPPFTQHVGFPGTFDYMICDAETSESEAQSLFRSEEYDGRVVNQHGSLDQRICRHRHQKCYARYNDCVDRPLWGYDEDVGGPIDLEGLRCNRLPLQLLRVCRQMYIETNPVLWRTNIWSFTHSRTCYKFLASRNAVQRRVFAKIHLDLDPRYSWKRDNWAHWWFCVLNRSLLKKFSAVSTIHIDITGNRWFRISDWFGGARILRPDLEFNMLLDLRCLAPSVLTVTCMETHNLKNQLMNHAECVEMAEDIHSKLFELPLSKDRPKYLTFSKTVRDRV